MRRAYRPRNLVNQYSPLRTPFLTRVATRRAPNTSALSGPSKPLFINVPWIPKHAIIGGADSGVRGQAVYLLLRNVAGRDDVNTVFDALGRALPSNHVTRTSRSKLPSRSLSNLANSYAHIFAHEHLLRSFRSALVMPPPTRTALCLVRLLSLPGPGVASRTWD
jgi:hypothetical protein